MSRKLPFHSYSGAEPYLFVSYAHKDEAQVFPMIRALHERRCRIWYDEGIEIGVNWPQTVAERLRDSDTALHYYDMDGAWAWMQAHAGRAKA